MMDGCGANDGPLWPWQCDRREDEWLRLRATESAVKRNQFFKRAPFVEHRVVEAPNHDVSDVWEAVGAKQVLRRVGCEDGERVLAFDPGFVEVVRSARTEHDRAVLG